MRARGVGARTVDEHAAECVLRLLVLVVRHRFRIRLEVLKLCRALRMQLHQELSRFRESGGPDVSIVHRWNLETALGVRNLTRGARTRLGLLSGRHARSAARGGPRDDARRRTRRQTSEEKRKAAFAWLQQAVLGSVHAHPESSIGSRILYTIVQGKARQRNARQRKARQGSEERTETCTATRDCIPSIAPSGSPTSSVPSSHSACCSPPCSPPHPQMGRHLDSAMSTVSAHWMEPLARSSPLSTLSRSE